MAKNGNKRKWSTLRDNEKCTRILTSFVFLVESKLDFHGPHSYIELMGVGQSLSRVWLCDSVGSSVHGILHARILEWVAILFSKGSSQPRDWTQASPLQANSLPSEPPQKPRLFIISPFSLRVLWFHFSIAMFCSFIKFKAFFANWSTINLQCCVSFNSTAKWFGFICIFFRLFSSIDYTRKNLNFYLFYILEADTHTVISEGSERQYW